MFLLIALAAVPAVFALQLVLCLKARKLWQKLCLPAGIALGELVFWGIVLLSEYRMLPYGAAFAGFIYAVIGMILAAAALCAWIVYGIMKLVQKRRKNFVMCRKNT